MGGLFESVFVKKETNDWEREGDPLEDEVNETTNDGKPQIIFTI